MKLRPYQVEALGRIKNGSILNGITGSGKSITALAYFVKEVCRGSYDPYSAPKKPTKLYIITTAKKRDSGEWLSDCAYFRIGDDSSSQFNIDNWNSIATIDSWNNIANYRKVEGAFFIFDEQRVCGSGKWAGSFIRIAKKNRWILLSATPGDKWTDYISVFIANGFYKNRTEFYRQHVIFNRFVSYPQVERYINENLLEYYRDLILIKMNYSSESERCYKTIFTKFDKETYSAIVNDRWNPYDNKPVENISQYCYLQRRVTNSDTSKLSALTSIFVKHTKLIIFYNFSYELDALRKWGKHIPTVVSEWNGEKHDILPTGESWVYLVQYMAGSEGWNCTTTDSMVFYSLPYSYKQFMQASGRIDRMNTPYSKLNYFVFRSKAPIDNSIQKCLEQKRDFNEKSYLSERGEKDDIFENLKIFPKSELRRL